MAINLSSLAVELMVFFREMEERKKINSNVIRQLNLFLRELYAKERLWVSRLDVPIKTAFVLYLAARNSMMILEKLIQKIEKANQFRQNPQVIREAMQIFPLIFDIYTGLEKAEATVPDVGFSLQKRIFDSVKTLRNAAGKFGLLPTFNEETRGIDREIVKEEFARWDKRVWMKAAYEL